MLIHITSRLNLTDTKLDRDIDKYIVYGWQMIFVIYVLLIVEVCHMCLQIRSCHVFDACSCL